ncbi:MAG: UDP-N-acetylglucosamine--N-acetylmuramyl-(pentapeptide) pyrophosphoryl-undecaprenol N-acetylglucosamine transferase, partial [Promethearchaeota archaeon]
GGYVTAPVIYAAKTLGIPIVVHESDAVMGLANKFAIRYAKKICLGFPLKYYKDLPIEKIIYTGNPVEKVQSVKHKTQNDKSKILNPSSRNFQSHYRASLKSTILIMGGSQGSRFINQMVAKIMPKLIKKYRVYHICGKNDYNWLKKNKWENYKLYDFTDKIDLLIQKSDLIISRAGANSLAEISAAGKPSIIIPLASAANDHQKANAEVYAKANAAIMVSESKLTSIGLKDLVDRIMENKDIRKLMSLSTKNLAQPGAARLIAKEILSQIK